MGIDPDDGGISMRRPNRGDIVKKLVYTLLATSFIGTPAVAQDNLAARFGVREAVQQISLSPDGTKVAVVGPLSGRRGSVMVADLKTGTTKIVLNSSGSPDRLVSCHWASDARLVCNVMMIMEGSDRLTFTRLVSINSDGSDLKMLSTRDSETALGIRQFGGSIIDWGPDGSNGSVLMSRTFMPEFSTGTRMAEDRRGLGVEIVDAASLKRHIVEQPNSRAVEYLSDGHGTVRVMGLEHAQADGYDTGHTDYLYRLTGDRDWKPLGELVSNGSTWTGFNPYAVDHAKNLVYGFEHKDGRLVLSSITLDGSLKHELVFAHPQVDVDGLVRIGRQERVVGVSFATDSRQTEFFDPELQKLRAGLSKALPKQPLVTFVDASADESKLLMYAGSDNDPGTYYLYDKATRQLEEVLPSRPQLKGVALATVKAIEFPAADGTRIPAYLTLPAGSSGKGLPAIVMPHGGPGSRDEWGFDWLAQFFAARGFAVLQPNFRGSTGYGEAWFQKNGFQSWKTAIGDVNDGGRWLLREGIAVPDKLGIVGWSYGGYAALQSSVLDPDLFKAIVAIAPVTDLETLRGESRRFTNFLLVDTFIGHGDHVQAGSPARNAAKIKAPVLMFHGDQDQNVGIGESRLMGEKLKAAGKRVELVEYKGLDHQLEDSQVRSQMLDRADQFLRKAMGMQP